MLQRGISRTDLLKMRNFDAHWRRLSAGDPAAVNNPITGRLKEERWPKKM
jgi:hypothetical protein